LENISKAIQTSRELVLWQIIPKRQRLVGGGFEKGTFPYIATKRQSLLVAM
jgi:hypothetical protein